MLEDFDNNLSILTESMARALNRRKFFTGAIKGVIATVAGVAGGTLVNVREAFAITCTCSWANNHVNCSEHGGCTNNGWDCPSGCSLCTTSSGCGTICKYQNGLWTSCTGLGPCGTGFRICTDCNCNGCSYICTCLSSCACCSPCCHSPTDVAAEMRRLRGQRSVVPAVA